MQIYNETVKVLAKGGLLGGVNQNQEWLVAEMITKYELATTPVIGDC